MDIRKVKKLIELVESSDISEIKISDDEGKIRISRRSSEAVSSPQVTPDVATLIHTSAAMVNADEEAKKMNSSNDIEDFTGAIVRSPMVGTFYMSSSPGQAPFVEIGSIVSTGQTLCIIEAMKVMNQITVENPGKVVKIFVQNAQPVEYNQPLFGIVS